MERNVYQEMAARGVRMPIGADLVLHEQPDPEAVVLDAERLGRVVEAAARRYRTPLAVPLMDLRLEKSDLLGFLGVPPEQVDQFHFSEPPAAAEVPPSHPFSPRIRANQGAVSYIAAETDLIPVGMLIGPFSLMTRLMDDPITAIALAGGGLTAEEDASVRMAERCLDLSLSVVLRSARAQIEAGAKVLLVCEPAANVVYLSPRQIKGGSGIFERFVLGPNRRLRALMEERGVDLIFHDCGELNTEMVRQFASELRPVILSFGSSRKLWEDAAVVPKDIVLYGNLPTRTFYSDAAMPLERVEEMTRELIANMRACGHPHILGSECDVLHVDEAAATIRRKVDAMMKC